MDTEEMILALLHCIKRTDMSCCCGCPFEEDLHCRRELQKQVLRYFIGPDDSLTVD